MQLPPAPRVGPAAGRLARRFTVRLTHGARDTTNGVVRMVVPTGWSAGAPEAFAFDRKDETRAFVFDVRPPAGVPPGGVTLRAEAEDRTGRRYAAGVFVVDYPHIRPRTFIRASAATVRVAPLALPRLARIGYVRGAADRVPEALRSVGLPVTLLDATMLER